MKAPDSSSVLNAQKASEILQNAKDAFSDNGSCIRQIGPTKRNSSSWDEFGPYFNGNAEIYKCLHEVISLTSDVKYDHYCKIVLIISNGKPFENSSLEELIKTSEKFRELNFSSIRDTEKLKKYLPGKTEKLKTLLLKASVEINQWNVFSLYVSQQEDVKCRTLFCEANAKEWRISTQKLFEVSSRVAQFKILPNVFRRENWTLQESTNPQENKYVKLFVHANNHSNLSSVCQFAAKLFTDKDCLSYVLTEVSLASCINQKRNEATPGNQGNSGYCIEYAAAAAMYLELHRIPNRRGGGYPTVDELREELIQHFRSLNGKKYTDHLDSFAQMYRLKSQKVTYQDALEAASNMHFVIAVFSWTKSEKRKFEKFFKYRPKGILRPNNLTNSGDGDDSGDDEEDSGDDEEDSGDDEDSRREEDRHAVVLTSFTSKFLRLMNSWGTEWADGGFFKIENSETLRKMEFIKIYFDKNRLTTEERTYGATKAATYLKNLQGIKLSEQTCPFCKLPSRVTEFKEVWFQTTCPKCYTAFTLDTKSGSNLALYQYLVSLSD